MAITYESGELRFSGQVTNAEFYSATSTAGLSLDTDRNIYVLDSNVRIMSDADLSGFHNVVIELNTKEIISESTDFTFNNITFIASGSRAVSDRQVFETANGGKTPKFKDSQFIHNISGNPGGSDPRYLSMIHTSGADGFTMRASDFTEQEIDGIEFTESGIYKGLSGIRVKRFIVNGNTLRVILKNITQSSKIYSSGGILGAYGGASIMVLNWNRTPYPGATGPNNWMDNYDGQRGNHWVYLLGTASSKYQTNGAGISQRKNQLHVVVGGYKYYNFIGGDGANFSYFNDKQTAPIPCFPTTDNAEMLEEDGSGNQVAVKELDSTEKVECVTRSLEFNRDTGSWNTSNYNNHKIKVRKYGKIFIDEDISPSINDVEGSEEAFIPKLILDDSIIVKNEADASNIQGITFDTTNKIITLDNTFIGTPQDIYDYSRWWLSQEENMEYEDFISGQNVAGNNQFVSDYKLIGNGELTINAESGTLEFAEDVPVPTISGTGTLNLGKATIINGITNYETGTIIKFNRKGEIHWDEEAIEFNGDINWNGGTIYANQKIGFEGSGTITINEGTHLSDDNSAITTSNSKYFSISTGDAFSGTLTINSFTMDGNLQFHPKGDGNDLTSTGSETVNVNSITFKNGANYEIIPRRDLRDVEFVGLGNNLAVGFNSGRVDKLINPKDGTNTYIGGVLTNNGGAGTVEIYKEIKFKFKDALNTNLEDVSVISQDTDNGNRQSFTLTNGNNANTQQTYFISSQADGETPTLEVLTGYVRKTATGADSATYDSGSIRYDRRGKTDTQGSTSNTDTFDFNVWSYNHLPATITQSLLENGNLEIDWTLFEDEAITESDASIVSGYSGINIDHTNQLITMSEETSLEELYDFAKYNKTLQANIEFPSLNTLLLSVNGKTLNTSYNISGGEFLRSSDKFDKLKTTGTISSSSRVVNCTLEDATFHTENIFNVPDAQAHVVIQEQNEDDNTVIDIYNNSINLSPGFFILIRKDRQLNLLYEDSKAGLSDFIHFSYSSRNSGNHTIDINTYLLFVPDGTSHRTDISISYEESKLKIIKQSDSTIISENEMQLLLNDFAESNADFEGLSSLYAREGNSFIIVPEMHEDSDFDFSGSLTLPSTQSESSVSNLDFQIQIGTRVSFIMRSDIDFNAIIKVGENYTSFSDIRTQRVFIEQNTQVKICYGSLGKKASYQHVNIGTGYTLQTAFEDIGTTLETTDVYIKDNANTRINENGEGIQLVLPSERLSHTQLISFLTYVSSHLTYLKACLNAENRNIIIVGDSEASLTEDITLTPHGNSHAYIQYFLRPFGSASEANIFVENSNSKTVIYNGDVNYIRFSGDVKASLSDEDKQDMSNKVWSNNSGVGLLSDMEFLKNQSVLTVRQCLSSKPLVDEDEIILGTDERIYFLFEGTEFDQGNSENKIWDNVNHTFVNLADVDFNCCVATTLSNGKYIADNPLPVRAGENRVFYIISFNSAEVFNLEKFKNSLLLTKYIGDKKW